MSKLLQVLKDSLEYTKDWICDHPKDFIVILFLCAIVMLGSSLIEFSIRVTPFLGFLVIALVCISMILILGFTLRIYRDEDVEFSDIGVMVKEGVVSIIILTVYQIIPLILTLIYIVFSLPHYTIEMGGDDIMENVALQWVCFAFAVSLIGYLFGMAALVHYANQERIPAAFQLWNIFLIIKHMGLIRYPVSWILLVMGVLCISELAFLVPYVGVIVVILITPICLLGLARFLGGLYAATS